MSRPGSPCPTTGGETWLSTSSVLPARAPRCCTPGTNTQSRQHTVQVGKRKRFTLLLVVSLQASWLLIRGFQWLGFHDHPLLGWEPHRGVDAGDRERGWCQWLRYSICVVNILLDVSICVFISRNWCCPGPPVFWVIFETGLQLMIID